ncbi:succinylglutamate desuccinylase/aspartoacylase family protein [Inquilinus sp. CAU 1745]|uniref:succinylglutamate desuccinylase/aspartoacylase domain-containing protein n=1 Tax=Inquilinus sp. CAU 1745 TaxID=3140369 RepID=UPI00325C0CB9
MTPRPPVEISPPDISAYQDGGTGVPWFIALDSGRQGPHVLLTALVHGNEPCGAIALDALMKARLRPAAGKVTLGFVNVAAYARFDPADPCRTRFLDQDMNRLWDSAVLEGKSRSRELDRARQIRPIVNEADMLLDLHSMQQDATSLILAGRHEKGLDLARRVGTPETVVRDDGHLTGRRLRDYGRFGDSEEDAAALLVECGQHWSVRAAETALETALAFLLRTGAIDRVPAGLRPLAEPRPQRVVDVTHTVTTATDRFTFAADFRGLEVMERAGAPIGRDGAHPILAPHDGCVIIMPCHNVRKGQTAVRLGRFVEADGVGDGAE